MATFLAEDHWGAGPSSADLHTSEPAGLGLHVGRRAEWSASSDFPPSFGLIEWKILVLSVQKKVEVLNLSWIYRPWPVLTGSGTCASQRRPLCLSGPSHPHGRTALRPTHRKHRHGRPGLWRCPQKTERRDK